MTFKKQGEGFFIVTDSSEVPDIERGDLEQALKKAALFLAIIFSYFGVFLAEQWNHDVTASSKTGILPGCLPFDRKIRLGCRKHNGKRFTSLPQNCHIRYGLNPKKGRICVA